MAATSNTTPQTSLALPRVAANAPIIDPEKLAQTTALYGPQGAQLVQRSQYLAQALDAMRSEGQNIRTPVALGTNLLADALLTYGSKKTNAALVNAYANQQQAAQNIERAQLGMPTNDAAPLPVDGSGINYAQGLKTLFGGVGNAAHAAWNGATGLFGGGSGSGDQGASSSAPAGTQGNPTSPVGEPQDPGYAPEGRPGPLQVSSSPQSTPTPSPGVARVGGSIAGGGDGAPASSSTSDPADVAMLLKGTGGGGPYPSIGPVSPAAQQLAAALAGNSGAPAQASASGVAGAAAPDYAPNFGDPHQDPAAFFSAALGGNPVTITSGFRTPDQNRTVGGSPTSSHLTGNAWDFTVPGMSSAQAVDALRQSGMPFDQIIDEGRDVHVGMDPRMRGMVMAGNGGRYSVVDRDTFGAPQPAAPGTAPQAPGGAPAPQGAPIAQGAPAAQPGQAGPAAQQPGLGTGGAPGGQSGMWRIADQPPAGGQWNIRNGVPYGLPPSDAEKQQVQALWANPLTRPQGDALAQQIMQRMRTPITYKQEISRDGQIIATPETPGTGPTYLGEPAGYTLGAGARITRQSDNTYAPTQGATYGPAGERPGMTGQYQTGPSGKSERVGEPPYGAPQTMPGAQGQFQQGPNGKMEQVAGPLVSVDQLMSARNTTRSSEPVATYYSTVSGLGSMKQMIDAATQPNGVISMEIIDRLTNMGAGGVATPAKVNLMLEHLGFPQEVAGHLTSLVGQGPITPETIRQLYGAGVAYATTQQKLAQQRVDEDTGFVKKNTGQDLGITLPALPSAPTAGWFNGGQGQGSTSSPPQRPVAGGGQPQPAPAPAAPQQAAPSPARLASPPAATLANARAAIQRGANPAAVAARLRSAGYDPSAL